MGSAAAIDEQYSNPNSYEEVPGELLGESIAKVKRVRHILDGRFYAQKRYNLDANDDYRRKELQELQNEVKIMKSLRGYDDFVRYMGHFEEDDPVEGADTFNIIIHPVAESNLSKRLRRIRYEFDPSKPQAPMPDDAKRMTYRNQSTKWLKQLASAMSSLHTFMEIRHRDIKPDNILVYRPDQDMNLAGDAYDRLLVSDFGISFEFLGKQTSKTYTENPHSGHYSAPEVSSSDVSRGRPSDVFSLGCVFFEIIAVMWDIPGLRDHTWIHGNKESYASKVDPELGSRSLREVILDCCNSVADLSLDSAYSQRLVRRLKLIRKMLQWDETLRPKSTDVYRDLGEWSMNGR